MDSHRFDALARGLATAKSRRSFLGAFMTGAAIAAGWRTHVAHAQATCFPSGDDCANDGNCCSASCVSGICSCGESGTVCFSGADCCPDHRCVEGAHAGGLSGWDGCVFCGAGASCDSNAGCCGGLVCVSGACAEATQCRGEGEACDGVCCDGYVCDDDSGVCVSAACTIEQCPGGNDFECCDGFYCVFQSCVPIPACAPVYCSSRVSCCDDKVCLDSGGNPPGEEVFSGGSCYVRRGDLCDANGDQGCEAGECIGGYCGGPPKCVELAGACAVDSDCCGDSVCFGSVCSVPSDDDDDTPGGGGPLPGTGEGAPANPVSAGGGDKAGHIVGLPSTGSGAPGEGFALGPILAGLGAATAAIAGRAVRSTRPSGLPRD